jgi:hypothetical protein
MLFAILLNTSIEVVEAAQLLKLVKWFGEGQGHQSGFFKGRFKLTKACGRAR